MAMKGLILNCLNRKEEAYDLVKRGLKNDLTSHVCWHVYGLLQRSEKKYDEAIKCYRNALRWDKENLHILRDLSMLQVHMRDMEGYRDTRYILLQLKSGQQASWIGYGVALHLVKDYDMAFTVLEEFRKTQQAQNRQNYEYSELIFYQVTILREARQHEQALKHMEKHKTHMLDKSSWLEIQAEILIDLEKYSKAEKVCTELLYRNPENRRYFELMERAVRPGSVNEREEIYDVISEIFPKSHCPIILPLYFTTGPSFKRRIERFLRNGLQRAVPPLFVILKPLYKDKEKVQIIEDIVLKFKESLENCEKFSPTDEYKQSPTVTLWTWCYIAQHFDKVGKVEEALQYINKAINHTPTLIELHTLKGKMLRHAGDMASAVASVDEAQSLDTADRFVNCKCACYMVRNSQIEEAKNVASKFTRENVSVEEYLREMQCMWFEVECAYAYFNDKQYGEALKKCYEIDRHFFEILEDQFDFHQYCMRKMTLRAYVAMLRSEDKLRSHKFYYDAATIAIKVYICLHDNPQQMNGDELQADESTLSKSELKKLRNKQRRQKRKQAEEEKKKQEQEKAGKNRQQKNAKDEEGDGDHKEELDAKKLVSVENPLQEARPFLTSLQLHFPTTLETHVLSYEFYEREKKFLLMIRSLVRAAKYAEGGVKNPAVHLMLMRFIKSGYESMGDIVKSVIESSLKELISSTEYEGYNTQYIQENQACLDGVLSGCRAMYVLNPSNAETAAQLLLSNWKQYSASATIKSCTEVLQAMRNGGLGNVPKEIELDYVHHCRGRFPRAAAFQSSSSTKVSAPESDSQIVENGTLSDNHIDEQNKIDVPCN